ncbi:hypothetical protein [Tamlana sp. I1]|uniref:hypothetical protein n=1 Tax=Tamlana sp. I1 TaxID=2762061 RepID=UPI00188F48CB|nr:hypothetical protein [Tamlana sp. I1]
MKNQKSKKYLHLDNKSLIIGSVVATFIAITPFLFYLHESVPTTKTWSTYFFTYHSGYFEDANTAMWILTGKAIPLYLLLIWFFTCRHWWYHVLLVPIFMYTYQIFSALNDDLSYIDSNQFYYLIPVMAIIIPSIYLVRARIFNKVNETNKSLQELEDELKISPKTLWETIKNYF